MDADSETEKTGRLRYRIVSPAAKMNQTQQHANRAEPDKMASEETAGEPDARTTKNKPHDAGQHGEASNSSANAIEAEPTSTEKQVNNTPHAYPLQDGSTKSANNQPVKPDSIRPDFACIPPEIAERNQWVNWAYVWKPKQQKWDKPPFVPFTRSHGSSTDPKKWFSLKLARLAFEEGKHDYDGVGFALENSGLVGLDLDDVYDPDTSTVTPWAGKLIRTVNSYTEFSPGGRGFKILARGKLPDACHVMEFAGGARLEAFDAGKYFTITGAVYAGLATIREYDFTNLWKDHEHLPLKNPKPNGKPAPAATAGPSAAQSSSLRDWLREHHVTILSEKWEGNKVTYEVPCIGTHGDYPKDDGKAFVIEFPSGRRTYGCHHNTCSCFRESGNHYKQFYRHYQSPRPPSNSQPRELPLPDSSAAAEAQNDDWQQSLMYSDKGQLLNNVTNMELFLTHHPAWAGGGLGFDDFANNIVITSKAPASIARGEIKDHVVYQIQVWMERNFQPKINANEMYKAILIAAQHTPIHPICDYLDNLPWDGKRRLPTLFQTYFGANGDLLLLAEIANMFLVSAVARVRRPGCQADHMLVLQGRQGIGKSQSLRALFGSQYFTDQMPSLDSKDASLQLRGKWGIEFAEFDRLSRHEASTVKAYVSRTFDTYRPPYGRVTADVMRQSIFVATINAEEFLTDDQNRRFWPVHCERIDVEAIRRDKDQLWAEANALYLGDCQWWPSEAVQAELTTRQEEREIENPYVGRIQEWFDRSDTQLEIAKNETWLTTARVLDALEFPIAQWKTGEQHISRAMRKLGYEKDRIGRGTTRFWRLKDTEPR